MARVACLPTALEPHNYMPSMLTAVGGPVPCEARQGRHRQRYGETGERLVAGCIPIKYAGAEPTAESVQVMLITSSGGGWVFPKGGWDNDETAEAAAMRETVEEAGVRGSIEEPLVGTFGFQSRKQGVHSGYKGRCCAHMFVMRVAEELDVWPECRERQRCWVPLSEAGSKCRHQWMKDALDAWVASKGWELPAAAPAAQEEGGGGASAPHSSDSGSSLSC